MPDEYIKRSDAIKTICENCMESYMCEGKCDEIDRIKAIPSADVEPVRHGRWVKSTGMMPPEFAGNYHCSECGWHGISAKEREYKRCPECGAKMDAEPPKEGQTDE